MVTEGTVDVAWSRKRDAQWLTHTGDQPAHDRCYTKPRLNDEIHLRPPVPGELLNGEQRLRGPPMEPARVARVVAQDRDQPHSYELQLPLNNKREWHCLHPKSYGDWVRVQTGDRSSESPTKRQRRQPRSLGRSHSAPPQVRPEPRMPGACDMRRTSSHGSSRPNTTETPPPNGGRGT